MTPGILQHPNFTGPGAVRASSAPGMYAADRCRRQAVTAAFAFRELCDLPVWTYDAEADEMGLECWFEVDGIDATTEQPPRHYFLNAGTRRERKVDADFIVYAQRKDLVRLGLLPSGLGQP